MNEDNSFDLPETEDMPDYMPENVEEQFKEARPVEPLDYAPRTKETGPVEPPDYTPRPAESPEASPFVESTPVQPAEAPTAKPASAQTTKPAVRPGRADMDAAITVYTPYQPVGPTATQLEKAANEARKEYKKQLRADKKRLKLWKQDARRKARNYLDDLSASESPDERASLKRRGKAEKKAWRQSLKNLDKSEKVLQKKAYKAFKHRLTRKRRVISGVIVLALLAAIVFAAFPVWQNIGKARSVKYTDSGENADIARLNASNLSQRIADEGIVLLRNRNGLLPLEDKKINIFGADAYNLKLGCDASEAVSLYEGLEQAGLAPNPTLDRVYRESGVAEDTGSFGGRVKNLLSTEKKDKDSETGYLTDDVINSAKNYSNQALIVLGTDTPLGEDYSSNGLALTSGRRALLRYVAGNFEHVIVVINSANPMELGILDELDSIEAVLWIGVPGPYGCVSLGKILTGEVNPSGRLTDTWAYEATSAPAVINYTTDKGRYTYSDGKNYVQYEEGIYVGYRYYETRYADNENGYLRAVMFPFGYGLSLTSFEWEPLSFKVTSAGKAVWRVKVTNTGGLAGRDVVQLYCSVPYTEGGTEKSEIQLAAYGKTSELQPGESGTLTLSFSLRDVASFDKNLSAYVLEAGEYTLSLRRNVRDCVASETYKVEEETVYNTDSATGKEISRQFEYASGDLTYLSRSEWTGTYPKGLMNTPGAETLKSDISSYSDVVKSGEAVPETGANNGIKLSDLKGLDYDDENWSEYLDQFTKDELIKLVSEAGWHTDAVSRLGIPAVNMLGGSSGLETEVWGKSINSAFYPAEIVLASTWNDDLAHDFGETVGAEAKTYGVQVWYAPGANLHRLPQGGNNYRNYSEDPLLSGKMAAAVIKGASSQGIIAAVGKLALDNRADSSGVLVWADEQALRELYLRPFEIAVKEGNTGAVMSSKSRIGYKWCGACGELLQNVLRNEWGFDGFVVSDVMTETFMSTPLACRRGNDLMTETGLFSGERRLRLACRSDTAGVLLSLRDCVHNYCYTLVNKSYYFQ